MQLGDQASTIRTVKILVHSGLGLLVEDNLNILKTKNPMD